MPDCAQFLYLRMVYLLFITVCKRNDLVEILCLSLMIRRPPRSTPKPSSAASDVYKRQVYSLGRLVTCIARLHSHGRLVICIACLHSRGRLVIHIT